MHWLVELFPVRTPVADFIYLGYLPVFCLELGAFTDRTLSGFEAGLVWYDVIITLRSKPKVRLNHRTGTEATTLWCRW